MDHQRMFRVIVVSGMGIAMPTLPVACGSGGAGGPDDASTTRDGFPNEGPPPMGDASRDGPTLQQDGFPQEGPAVLPDTGTDGPAATDAPNDVEGGG